MTKAYLEVSSEMVYMTGQAVDPSPSNGNLAHYKCIVLEPLADELRKLAEKMVADGEASNVDGVKKLLKAMLTDAVDLI